MISRLYVDNFRCLVNLELRLRERQVLLGENGSGKSSVLDVLWRLRRLVVDDVTVDEAFPAASLTRWQSRPLQSFEIDVAGNGGTYLYRLVVEHEIDRALSRIHAEELSYDGKPLYGSKLGDAQLYRDDHTAGPPMKVDWRRPGIAILTASRDNKKLAWFRDYLARLIVARPEPRLMTGALGGRHDSPGWALERFAAWYTKLAIAEPQVAEAARNRLREVLPGFRQLRAPNDVLVSEWVCEPTPTSTVRYDLGFDELSEGQKCLVALHVLLEAWTEHGGSMLIDEPDNFLMLGEIQPWLDAVSDRSGGGAQITVISHHPEVLDVWAREHGLVFRREAGGPTRVGPLQIDAESALTPSEAIARGWTSGH